jgi:hypothetical protein
MSLFYLTIGLKDYIESMLGEIPNSLIEEVWLCLDYMAFNKNATIKDAMSEFELTNPLIPVLAFAYEALNKLNENKPMPVYFNKYLDNDFKQFMSLYPSRKLPHKAFTR